MAKTRRRNSAKRLERDAIMLEMFAPSDAERAYAERLRYELAKLDRAEPFSAAPAARRMGFLERINFRDWMPPVAAGSRRSPPAAAGSRRQPPIRNPLVGERTIRARWFGPASTAVAFALGVAVLAIVIGG